MRKLDFHPKVFDDLKDLPPKHYKQVMSKVMELVKNPTPHDSLELKGYKSVYRATSGEYRIVYLFDDENLYINTIGLRNDDAVYKLAARRLS
jgi:mRNA interferase RelE/StbE